MPRDTEKESASGTFGGKDNDTLGGRGSLDNTWSKSFSAIGTAASGGLAWGSYSGAWVQSSGTATGSGTGFATAA